jgi:hypothetical protein
MLLLFAALGKAVHDEVQFWEAGFYETFTGRKGQSLQK